MQDFPDFQIPPFVEKACLHIEEVLLDEEGIFRKSAPTEETKHYRNLLADGEQVELWYLESEVVCDLLKLYLRELPDPLLTFELYDCFLAQCQCAKQANAKLDLRKSIQLLPAVNKALLKRLVFCLRKVKLHSDKNRMNASNLGLIFGPNLLRAPNDREKHDMIADVPLVNAIALALIEDYDRLFSQVNYRPNYLCYARAWYDYTAASPSELSFSKGDVLLVMDKHNSGWWKGEKNGVVGYFPATYCAYLNGQMCGEKTNKENEEDNEEDEWTKREMEILTDKERIQRAIAELSNSDEEERPGESAELLPAKSVVASSY
ncbi:Protein fam13b [Balamuthia mandrillaris]